MANRHKFKRGGSAMSGRDDYSGTGEPNVVKEAKEKKSGGAVMKNVGGAVPGKKCGGRIAKARGGSTSSPYSSAGGGGATSSPFSSAHRG